MRKFSPTGTRGLESRPKNTRADITANSIPPLACLPLAFILRKLMLRRNVQRVFPSYIVSKLSKAACWLRKVKDCRPIRLKKIRTRASLRTFTIQTGTKLLFGGNRMDLIDGIGGAFLFSNNPKRLAEWYRDNLGISGHESPDGRTSS